MSAPPVASPISDASTPLTVIAGDASARAFSLAAKTYDAEQARNRVARWSRARSLRILERTFTRGQIVLEIGCGTGAEAIYLARRGVSVVATDAAEGMLEVTRNKLTREDSVVRKRITLAHLPAHGLAELSQTYGEHTFDGAYSSFGPLNCEPDLETVTTTLGGLVKPGGRVVLSLINRYCHWETLWYLAARQPRKAFRRWSGHTSATVHADRQDDRIPVYYWSPRELERIFGTHFKVTKRVALPWLLPPQYLDGILKGRTPLFRLLSRVDRGLAGVWPFYALGDHILLEMVRLPLK